MGHIQSEKATLVSGLIMILFLFVGEQLLNLIGIDIASFALAGAFVIFLLALEMILNIELFKSDEGDSSGSIVPIAFPLIAGSGTLTTLISLRSTYSISDIIIGVILNLVFVYVILKSVGKLFANFTSTFSTVPVASIYGCVPNALLLSLVYVSPEPINVTKLCPLGDPLKLAVWKVVVTVYPDGTDLLTSNIFPSLK